ncbi:hypothetical protein [Cellulomonas sp. Leaf334]|uniref:hypothetical protein n=1 Tax=Cellulomonas sp. Leaf334 TaxID=1736339 RepID=UPI0006F8F4A0|nr:hypothetical protein [Cellulomonas sp. Leaf334]KQR17199.1 hypothetical protein ASF78_07820 [Cellulomonas sp. Leaf334]
MERDLTDFMHANVQAREESIAGLAPSAGALSGTVRRVKRRRAVRHSVQGVGAGAAVAVVAGASWFGLRSQDPVPPAISPSPTVTTPTPTPSPTPTPTPSETAVTPPPVPASFGQPDSEPITRSVLAQAEPGWVLAMYTPSYVTAGSDEWVAGSSVLYAASPSGDRYKVLDLPAGPDEIARVVHWKAGESRAIVQLIAGPHRYLDLLTGVLTPVPGAPENAFWIGVASTGSTVWQTYEENLSGSGYLVSVTPDGVTTTFAGLWPQLVGPMSPDRNYMSIGSALIDLRTGHTNFFQPAEANRECPVSGWLSDSVAVVWCEGDADGGRVYRTTFVPEWDPPTMPKPEPLYDGMGWQNVAGVFPLDDGRHVVSAQAESGTWGAWLVDGGDASQITQASDEAFDYLVDVVGDVVLATDVVGDGATTALTAHDLRTGTDAVLMPRPTETGEEYGLGPIQWVGGLSWWIPGTSS